MKHVDVKYRFIQESIKMEEIGVRCLSTKLNWADVLTKALVPKKHKDALEAIIGSKEAYRLVVTQKGVESRSALDQNTSWVIVGYPR
jgi:hypothetical protein